MAVMEADVSERRIVGSVLSLDLYSPVLPRKHSSLQADPVASLARMVHGVAGLCMLHIGPEAHNDLQPVY